MSDLSSVESTNESGGVPNDRDLLVVSLGNEGGRESGERVREKRERDTRTREHRPRTVSESDDRDFTILANDTTHTTTASDANSPSTREETDSTLREPSPERDPDYPPVSPVQPFFDALETIATMSRPNSPAAPPTNHAHQAAPTVSALVGSFLISGDHALAAPAVSRESSLSVPFSDSFPLFICLAIIVQHRSRILHGNLDFVGLSVLLNTQAGAQNLDLTLRIARKLYERYRAYQRLCFGPRFAVYEVWLDNMETLFGEPVATATNQHVQNGEARGRNGDGDEGD